MTDQATANELSDEQRNAIFRDLRALKRQHENKLNKDDLAVLLIGAAIANGFDGGRRITGMLAKLGMNRQHAGIILTRHTGDRWLLGSDGRYSFKA